MNRRNFAAGAGLAVCLAAGALPAALAPGAARAAGLPQHSVVRIEHIDAPPAKVWAIIKNFPDLTWHPAIKTSSATEGNTPGSVRTLDLGGPKLIEQLVRYDDAHMTYTYKITEDPANVKTLPVSHYTSTITVKPGPHGSSVVTWRGTFERGDPAATPAAGEDDAAAVKAVTGVYTGGLANLKKLAEAQKSA